MSLPSPAPDLTCLVTGASSGIGADIARALAALGYGVTLTARRSELLEALAAELARPGLRVEVVAADLGVAEERERLLAEVASRGLALAALVNNAGFGTVGAVALADTAAETAMVRLNVEAVVDLTTRALPAMVSRGSGGILTTASTAAFQPLPGQAAYGASKAFVLSYCQALAAELAGSGVTVTTLCPGPVETGFADAAGFSEEEFAMLPSFMRVSSPDVARVGVEGLVAGRGVVIPGYANLVSAQVARLLPRRLLLPLLARQHPALRRPTPS